MKKILSLLTVSVLLGITALAQSPAPGIFNYQGVARNSVGNVLVNQTISLRLTIHDGSPAGAVVYQEVRSLTTNPFGLFNVQVGSPGASSTSGSITGTNWGVNAKYIQVEIDPAGGSTFINIGTAQLASVPYSLYSSLSNDLVLPFNKTQAAAGTTLFGVTNSSATGTRGAIEGTTASTDANAYAITGTVSSSSPGGFSAGVRGINNGTGGLGIGVYGSQAGSGWGVYGTANGGIGVNGSANTGIGGNFSSTSGTGVIAASTSGDGLRATTNGAVGKFGVFGNATADATGVAGNSGSGIAVLGVSGTGPSGVFQNFTATSTANTLSALNQGGSGDALSSVTTGSGRAGFFQVNNAASVTAALQATHNGTAGNVFAVLGTISSTSPGGFSAAVRGVNNGTGGLGIGVWGSQAGSGWGVYGTTDGGIGVNSSANSGIGVNGSSNTGTGGRFTTSSGLALFTTGALRLQGIGEALNKVLTSDAAGNATWQTVAAIGGVTGSGTVNFVPKWTPSTTNLGNSLIFDDGASVAVGTTTPTHRFTVNHSGSTGIGVNSTSGFSVVDINAASGDAALRFGNAGVNQWNIRNQPGNNNLQIFELGGGGERMHIEDGTGNISIGGAADPLGYRLNILHGGSSGILNKSTASFSVFDIDAFSGDAAIRFANNGVNQWNLRNQPGTNNLQIFELGGGGERMHIEDGTGNISIGGAVDPLGYRLNILHGGSTGILNKSTASYSVFDIDAFSGDAAIRFANNGVNQWNLRNQPGTNNLQIFELGGGGERMHIEDGTGNISIGGSVDPLAYRLDILHGGSSGERIKSSASFSVLDIDAFSGDAAIRLANNGVNQWNLRNQPGTDNLQIFELGGGGERMHIEDATGNISIGGAIDPLPYRLDILHGGSSGIRNKSTSSFSTIDIDAFSGDAALRFANNGVNQWNIRNQPGTNNLQIFELGGGGERMRIDDGTGLVVISGGLTVLGAPKLFTMDHPLDPENKTLKHASAESNEVINFYSGNVVTDANGKATVQLPDYFEAINKDPRYQLTVIGTFAQAIISKKVQNNQFEITTNQPNVEVSWEVKGVRNDRRMQKTPFHDVEVKSAAQKGKYWDPAAYDLPNSRNISYDPAADDKGNSSLNFIAPVSTKPAPASTGGSLDFVAPKTTTNKTVDNSGSVEDSKPAEKKAEVKPADIKGTSVEDIKKPAEIKKPVEEKKNEKSSVSEKTKTD